MKGYVIDLEKETVANTNFRRVLYTGHHTQLVLMSSTAGGGDRFRGTPNIDQFFRFDSGTGKVVIDGVEHEVRDGFGAIVPRRR